MTNSVHQISFGNISAINRVATKRLVKTTSPILADTFEKGLIRTYAISAQDQIMGVSGLTMPDLTITLKRAVEGEKLREAINEALELHPLYKTKLAKDKRGLFVWQTNEKKPVILKQKLNKDVVYGTDDFANYPWLVTFDDKKIVFTATHMLSDGVGTFNFMRTFLRFYFEKTGAKFKDVAKWDITKRTAALTSEDPYLKYAKLNPQRAVQAKQPNYGSIIAPQFLMEQGQTSPTYRFTIDKATIKSIAAHNQTSPAPIISSLLVKAMQKTMQMKTGIITIPIPVNCRARFETYTDRNFLQFAPLSYDISELGEQSVDNLSKLFRAQLDDSITLDSSIATFKQVKKLTDDMRKNPQILAQIQADAKNSQSVKTATINYSHVTKPGFPKEFDEFIDNIEVDCPLPAKSVSVLALAVNFKDKINLKIRHVLKDNAFIKNLCQILEEEKIPYEMQKMPKSRDAGFQM